MLLLTSPFEVPKAFFVGIGLVTFGLMAVWIAKQVILFYTNKYEDYTFDESGDDGDKESP